MRIAQFLIFCFVPFWGTAQTIDAAASRQVDSLLKVSRAFSNKGQFEEAFARIAAAEKIALSIGPTTVAYARCCHDRGRTFYLKGDWSASEKCHLEALSIREKVLGKEHYDYVVSLNNVAFMNEKLGNYEKAEPLYLEAIAILGKTVGKEHLAYAKCLNSLAILYQQMGLYEKAEPIQLEVRAMREKTLGKEHIDYAATLNNLAVVYWSMGQYEKAEPLMIEAIAINEKKLGKEHPDYAKTLNSLASLYQQTGNYERAESIYLEANAILGKTLGTEHTEYAMSLNNLGTLYLKMGQYEKAERAILEGAAIWRKILGEQHPFNAISVFNLAEVCKNTGRFDQAAILFPELAERSQALTVRALQHLSEREMDAYLNTYAVRQERTLSFARISGGRVADVCFDNSLFYKGFLLNAAGRIRRLALSDVNTAAKFEYLKSCQRRLAAQYAQPIADRSGVEALENEANDLEKDLARTVKGYGDAMRQVKWQDVQRALPPDGAAIEFVHFTFSGHQTTDSTLYAALLLLPGANTPKFIPLFEEKQLASLLKTEGRTQPDFYNNLYAPDKKGRLLYDLIWQPIAAELPAAATVYAAPSGLLHRLNLGAIPAPDGKTPAQKYHLTVLGSTRQLAVPPTSAAAPNVTAMLYGGVQYDATPEVASHTDPTSGDMSARRGADFAQNDSTLRGENWHYLRWTEVEISAAAELMKGNGITPVSKKGAAATEESFKALGEGNPSPRILHIATHGFFFPDPHRTADPVTGVPQAVAEKTFKVSKNPMIRSGLVLAGANHAWKTGKPAQPGLEDGILTAYEISQMNLSNTELAVLSACETGLGDLVGNEGVYGLQRAFKIAGVRYLIMSLWQVPDFQTQVFMSAFYKHWLAGKMAVPEAFRATQSELRTQYGEAFKWAGFVLVE